MSKKKDRNILNIFKLLFFRKRYLSFLHMDTCCVFLSCQQGDVTSVVDERRITVIMRNNLNFVINLFVFSLTSLRSSLGVSGIKLRLNSSSWHGNV